MYVYTMITNSNKGFPEWNFPAPVGCSTREQLLGESSDLNQGRGRTAECAGPQRRGVPKM